MEKLAGVFFEGRDDGAAEGGGGGEELGPKAAAAEEEEPAPPPPVVVIGPAAPPVPIGPAAPPPEVLAAAAAAAGTIDEEEEDEEIGPAAPPPEVEATEEGSRISKLLSSSASAEDDSASPSFDSYDILGLPAGPATTTAEIKRAYKRLSLLTHPDKATAAAASSSSAAAAAASAAAAAAAFAAVAAAATELQDPEKREEVDRRREKREERRAFAAFVAGRERERAWKRARGEEIEKEEAPGASAAPKQREEWMTALPEFERRPPTVAQQQQSVTAFSQRGRRGAEEARADAGWAEKPCGGG